MPADRNLLFGVLAVELDFVDREVVVEAITTWRLDDAKPLGEALRDSGHLTPDRLQLLDAVVDDHIRRHGDANRSLASVDKTIGFDLLAADSGDGQRTLNRLASSASTAKASRQSPVVPTSHSSGRYRILRPHARGGLGEVFVAEDTELGRHVALKEMREAIVDNADARGRFVLEAEVTGGLEHPGIVPVYGLGTHDDGRPYYAMRFIQGETLKDAIRRFHERATRERPRPDFGSLAFRDLLKRFVDVCNAVAYAHSRGVLHRDLKPANVMLGQYGETLVVDWGLAKALGAADPSSPGGNPLQPRSGADSSATVAGRVLGTPAYMSPEQADGRVADLGPATDVYSLGATLYELLTERTPYGETSLAALLDAVKSGGFVAPCVAQPAVPRPLAAICAKAMALHPADRYPSALTLARDVERWLADEPVTAYREPIAARLRRWAKQHRTWTTAATVGLVVAALTLTVTSARLATARAESERQGEIARRQRERTREALDDMTSEDASDWLSSRQTLSASQRTFLEKSLAYYREFAAESGTDRDGRVLVAKAQGRVGWLLAELGRPGEAEGPLLAARDQFATLIASEPSGSTLFREAAGNTIRLGQLFLQLGRPAEAEVEFRAALTTLNRQPWSDAAGRQIRATALNNLGIALAERGRPSEAKAAYESSRSALETLVAEVPTDPRARRELALTLMNLGALYQSTHHPEVAERSYRSASELLEKLAGEYPAAPAYRRESASIQFNLAGLLNELGRTADADTAYRAARAGYTALVSEFPAVLKYRHDLATAHGGLGILLRGVGKPTEAVREYRTSASLLEALVRECPTVPVYGIELGRVYHNLGNVTNDRDAAAAREWYDQALRLLVPFHTQPVHAAGVHEDVLNCYQGRAEANAKAGQAATALADWDRASELADAGRRAEIAVDRADCQARSGEPTKAMAAVAGLTGPDASGERLFRVACVYAVAAVTPQLSPAESERSASRAVELLRRTVETGYRDTAGWLGDEDLTALRRRDDFASLLWELADGLPSTDRR